MKDEKKDENKDYNNKDVEFVRMMIPHHQKAVDEATDYFVEAKNKKIKKIAEDIVFNQMAEIKTLKKWLKDRGLSEKSDKKMKM